MASTSSRRTPGREVTVMGMETEYGILGAEPEDVVAACLEAESEQGRCPGVRWDYSGEYPLRDARGFEVDRSAVDPSMLTDIPGAASTEGPVPGRLRTTAVVRLTAQEEAWQRGTATCLSSGGRLYVDHGHPEYATPECTGAAQATLADRAGDLLVARGAELLRRRGVAARLFKNNVDGKGATYGTHENYLVPRAIDFDDLVQALVPLLVVRPLLVGSGRVGTGAVAQGADFQISQRADYLEKVVGLGTTVDRPLVNTRDEPHADAARLRRLHVTCADTTMAEPTTGLRSAVTLLLLDALEAGWDFTDLILADPLATLSALGESPWGDVPATTVQGRCLSAVDIQEAFLERLTSYLGDAGVPDFLRGAEHLLEDLAPRVISALRRHDTGPIDTEIDWAIKRRLMSAQRERHPQLSGDALGALRSRVDLAYHDLNAETGLGPRLVAQGAMARLCEPEEI